MSKKDTQELMINGMKITLRDLQSVISGTKALIINKILYYSINRKFIVCNNEGNVYVRKSLREWSYELERWYENGKKKRVSKSCIGKALNELVNSKLLIKLDSNDSRIAAYKLCQEELQKRLKHLFFDVHFRSTFVGNYDESVPKVQRKYDESKTKVDDEIHGCQGLKANSGSGTYTNTYTYNKSYKSEEKEKHQNIVQKMFQIWEEEFPKSGEILNQKISCWMKAAFDKQFEADLSNWKNYLKTAKTSKFIISKPHLLKLKWLLNFETIANIRKKAYEVAEPELDFDDLQERQQRLTLELNEQIELLNEHKICKKQRKKILDKIGPFAYHSWFSKISMEFCDNEIKCLGSRLNLDRIAIHYNDLLRLDADVG